MKNFLNRLFLIIFIFATTPLLATIPSFEEVSQILEEYSQEWKLDEKEGRIYIKPEALSFENHQIKLIVGPCEIPLDAVYCDDDGIYVCARGPIDWQCCRCQGMNPNRLFYCRYCGEPKCGY